MDNDGYVLTFRWSFDAKEWKRLHLEDYLVMTTEFMEELEKPQD